ncbi:MAG: hypothetical protein AAF821_17885 [Cyanobacteria bacterium P01_D01_bin.156]
MTITGMTMVEHQSEIASNPTVGQREITQVCLGELPLTLISDCFGDHRIVEVVLPRPIALKNLQNLSHVSQCTILKDLPRPFFRIDCSQRFLLTGIVHDARVRFTLRETAVSQARLIVLHAVAELMQVSLDVVPLEPVTSNNP